MEWKKQPQTYNFNIIRNSTTRKALEDLGKTSPAVLGAVSTDRGLF